MMLPTMGNCEGKTKQGDLCGNIAVKGARYCYLHVGRAQVGFLRRVHNRLTNKDLGAYLAVFGLPLGVLGAIPFFGWFQDYQRPIVEMATVQDVPGGTVINDAVMNQKTLVRFVVANVGRTPAYITGSSVEAELGPDAEKKLRVQPWIPQSSRLYKDPMQISAQTTEPVTSMDDPHYDKPDSIAVWVRIRYRDWLHHQYESDICFKEGLGRAEDFCQDRFHGVIDCEKEKCDQFSIGNGLSP
jgi:hypothetical protein